MPTEPYGCTIFCDDIRAEVDNKFSLMGVYTGSLVVHSEFPVTLPKFALAVRYRVAFDDDRLEDVQVAVFLPGDEEKPSVAATIPISRMLDATDSGAKPAGAFREFHANIVLAPLTLKQKGKISVRARGGAGVIRLGALNVDQHLPTQSAEVPS